MEIRYRNNRIRKVCCDSDAARKAYGEVMAKMISVRIDQLSAADSVEEMMQCRIGRCHPLTGNRKGQYAVDLAQPYRLLFIQVGGEIQIAEVQEIVDYH